MPTPPSPLDRLRAAADVLELAPAHVAALLVLASVACAGLVGLWWLARPSPGPPTAPAVATIGPTAGAEDLVLGTGHGTAGGAAGTATSVGASPPADVVVHVSGAVASEGVLTLPGGARVVDAVEAAGGASGAARTDQLNLARPVQDGEQVHVPTAREVRTGVTGRPGAPGVAAAGGGAAAGIDGGAPGVAGGGAAGTVSLNRATATELEALPGVGPVLAQRVIEHREAIGGFTSVEQLLEVDGIGDQTLAELRGRVAL
jgi:competence protein ComEA